MDLHEGACGAGQLFPSPPMSKARVGSHVNCLGCSPELRSGTRLRATLSVRSVASGVNGTPCAKRPCSQLALVEAL